ncbi:pectinesterase inhibitor 9 [Impatiens glandulifera]|uniref:pectinesterase inhibitor 9 n=1 Tax=Impatiens glandulifera TaxID=253017 RepID=UPI001FB1656C|nr:pectinesterase inhibitor 9 [Impatiens glandulifera]
MSRRRNQIHSSLVSIAILIHLQLISVTVAGDSNATDFIRTSCNDTLYPDVCYTSLAGYANAVQQDAAALVTIALTVTLSNAHQMSIYTLNLTRSPDYVSDRRSTAALRDCVSLFKDAVCQVRDSIKQMKELGQTGGGASFESVRFGLSNVQTWMSSALTNEDTCIDGFNEVADVGLKMDVCDRSTNVIQVTSNALALVNRYVDKLLAG